MNEAEEYEEIRVVESASIAEIPHLFNKCLMSRFKSQLRS